MLLTPHFPLTDVTRSRLAAERGIDNTLDLGLCEDKVLISNARDLAEFVLEPIRAHFGVPITPSSWYRCPKLNRAVGGSRTSDHVQACAADIELRGVPNRDLAEWISQNLKFKQLILEYTTVWDPAAGWVHVSYLSGENGGEVLTKNLRGYSHGLHPKT